MKSDAIKVNNMYYHEQCEKERELKETIRNYYIEKYNSKEPKTAINKAIKQYINDQNFDAEYVLFVLKQNVKLKGIFALIYYLNDKSMREKYAKANMNKVKIDTSKVEIKENTKFTYTNKNKKSLWGDTICR